MAREAAPSIIFMDEIDSIGQSCGGGGGGGGDSEVQRTMLELLNQLMVSNRRKISYRAMATNRIDILMLPCYAPAVSTVKLSSESNGKRPLFDLQSQDGILRNLDLYSISEKYNASGAECKAVCTEVGMFVSLRERCM
jgi:26S proteasome regulatory subunit T6